MLEELQSLSDGNKKRVLVISTTVIMIIIIGAWATYFNSVIMGTTQQASDEATIPNATTTPMTAPTAAIATMPVAPAPADAQAHGYGLWQNIKNGFGPFVNIFQKPSQYTIKPQ